MDVVGWVVGGLVVGLDVVSLGDKGFLRQDGYAFGL